MVRDCGRGGADGGRQWEGEGRWREIVEGEGQVAGDCERRGQMARDCGRRGAAGARPGRERWWETWEGTGRMQETV